ASAAWTSDGEVIPESQFVRHKDDPHKIEIPEFYAELGGNFIFGGVYFDHYGHCLLATLSRMWKIRNSDCKIIWLKPDPKLRVTSYQQDIFEILGINPVRHLFCRGGVKVDNLLVPSPGAILGRGMSPQLGEALGVFPFSEPQKGKNVWLSRSKLADRKSKVENESDLEEILIAAGWDVIHPETMRVPDQLMAMSNAEVVAGFDGSAFHTLLLADKP
ncbi:glycosyltransferase family 61 protein, partial [Staphylococcus arlettae]